jgi:hypothetical protein
MVEEGILTGLKILFYIENRPSASGLVPKSLHAKFRRALKAGFFVSQNLENSEVVLTSTRRVFITPRECIC